MYKKQNKMWSTTLLAGVVTMSALMGCSSPQERKQANTDFDYLDAKLVTRPFTVPGGLQAPAYGKEFTVPPLPQGAEHGPLGDTIDVRPPMQVLAMVPGSRSENSGNNITLWFTARSVTNNVDNEVWNYLLGFMTRRGIAIRDFNTVARTMDTEPFDATANLHPWSEAAKKNDETRVHQSYRFRLQSDPVMHRTGLTAELLQHEAFIEDEDKDETPLTVFERRRYSALMLNQVVSDYDQQVNLRASTTTNGRLAMSLGVDDNGLTAWLVDATFDETWQRLNTLLPKLNFEIASKHESKGLIIVDYDEPDSDFWKAQDIEPFGLDSGIYRLQLGEFKGKTSITLFDEDKKPVPTSVVSKMYLGLSKAFGRQSTVGNK